MTNARRFFGKILIIAIALILADMLIGRWLSHAYSRIAHGEQGRMTFAIDSTTAPLLIIGSSRAAHHYVPAILSDSLHLDAYNAGKDKQGVFYALSILTAILRRYHPNVLLLDITPDAFVPEEAGLDELAVLLPYYRTHPEIRPVLDKRSAWECWKTRSYLYCYNSLVLQILKRSFSDTEDDSSSNGYLPKFLYTNHTPAPDLTESLLTGSLDTATVAAFETIITLARKNHCRLAVIVSPVYFPLNRGSSTIAAAGEICRRRGIDFLDYTRSPGFAFNNGLFVDAIHLNDAGATRFTRLLSTDLLAKGFH